MKQSRQGEGSRRTDAPTHLKGEATIEIYVAKEHGDGSVRYGYIVRLGGKIAAEPTKTFRTRKSLRKHADDLVDDLFQMFGKVSYEKQTAEVPRLQLVLGGLSEADTTTHIEAGTLRLAA